MLKMEVRREACHVEMVPEILSSGQRILFFGHSNI